VYDRICRHNGEDDFEDIRTIDYIPVTARIARRNLQNLEVTPYQRVALRRGLVHHPDDRVSNTLEEAMRYSAMLGWMCFDQMASMNTRIPLFGEGNYTQLRGDVVDHDERLEELEWRYQSHEEELERLYQQDWDEVGELRERVGTLEQTLEMTQAALGRATVCYVFRTLFNPWNLLSKSPLVLP
jgi:hypothetical protein